MGIMPRAETFKKRCCIEKIITEGKDTVKSIFYNRNLDTVKFVNLKRSIKLSILSSHKEAS